MRQKNMGNKTGNSSIFVKFVRKNRVGKTEIKTENYCGIFRRKTDTKTNRRKNRKDEGMGKSISQII